MNLHNIILEIILEPKNAASIIIHHQGDVWVCIGCIGFSCDLSGGQNYLLLAMAMAKVGGPLSAVKVLT